MLLAFTTMLRVDLGQLDREGSTDVEATVASDDELWQDTDLEWVDGVKVRLRASYAGTGEVVARGKVEGTLVQQCRRCLERVDTVLEQELTMVFVEDADEDEDGGAFPFEVVGEALDLSRAVREELVLAMNPFVVCKPECRGLCPLCGKDLNAGSCDCTLDEPDPRWAALRELKSE